MQTPAHLEALVTSVSRPMAWRHTTERDRALEAARRDRKRREKLASLEVAMKFGIKHFSAPVADPVPTDPVVVWHTGLSHLHHPFRAKRLIYAFCQVTSMKYNWMVSKGRKRSISVPRHILMWLLKKNTDQSLPCIGRVLGGRDHSTILYGVRKVSNTPALLAVAEEIEKAVLAFERDTYGLSQTEGQS